MTVSAAVWEVVGGARNGGIVVRSEKERSSQESSARLMAGALVRVLQYDAAAGRMRYELMSGSGPRTGWVTTKSQGKELMRPWQGPLTAMAGDNIVAKPKIVEEMPVLRKETTVLVRGRRQQDKNAADVGGLGVVSYAAWQAKGRFGSLNGKVAPKPAPEDCACQSAAEDGPLICAECQLPIGDFAYRTDEDGPLLHGECQAQLMLQRANKEEKSRKRRDAELKRSRRADYDIGWKVERVPRNLNCARKMGFAPVANGMYALTFDEESKTARIAPTANPTVALNLEYLALALQVRMRDGREPMFSLDPKTAEDRAKSMWQVKRFEPAWLAGTSVGEAMFQADVHLKELSMGEYMQPVMGMKSCFDFQEEDSEEVEWNAREWFVVRKAEVHVTEENALLPCVKMGVEAREQIVGEEGLEDARLTSPEHPLVKYAEAFEHNFDLIAERKSAVYHLREACKASVLAKFLVDNEVLVEESFFNFEVEADESCRPEIPQLWNERFHSQIAVRDGLIVGAEQGVSATKHGLYGGVQFGLEAAQAPGVAVRRGPPLTMAKGQLSRAPTASGLLAGGQEGFAYTPMPGVAAPRGVDLNLDGFDLSEAKKERHSIPAFAPGSAFFRSLDGNGKAFSAEDLGLLKSLFNPLLSDRRMDGEAFTPPDASPEYLERLRTLIGEEKAAFEKRKEHFLSPSFRKAAPGPLFPSDWVPAHELTHGQAAGVRELHAREDYGTRMERMLKTSTPVFDKAAEDGAKFRIYEVGSLEVRTIQEHDGSEQIGAVFSTRAPRSQRAAAGEGEKQDDTIVRATQFVEGTQQTKDSKRPPADIRFYVVFETSAGDFFMTEKIGDHIAWVQNPDDLEARNSYAKATRSVDCSGLGVTLLDVKKRRGEELARLGRTHADRARYAEDVYSIVLPAWRRSWSLLLEKEKLVVEQLGLQALWAQEEGGSGEASRLSWADLDEAQRELACSLGFDEASWGEKVCWVQAEKRWAQLTSSERQAAGDLGVNGAAAWDGASRRRLQEASAVWSKSWAKLTEAEREAAKALGVPGAGAWDTGRWSLGGAWQRRWAELTDAERKAAEELGAADADAWDRRSARVWRQGWQDLSAEERAAAGRIGFDRDCWARFA